MNADQLKTQLKLDEENFNDSLSTSFLEVYRRSSFGDEGSEAIHIGFAKEEVSKKSVTSSGWLINSDDGKPGFLESSRGGTKKVTYYRNHPEGIEQIVFLRNFHGVASQYLEISQEFVLLFNLIKASDHGGYKLLNDDGTQSDAIFIDGNISVRVRRDLIRRYQAAKQLYLVYQVDHIRFGITESNPIFNETSQSDSHFFEVNDFSHVNMDGYRFCGIKIFEPPAIENCHIWPFEKEELEKPKFLINVDENLNETYAVAIDSYESELNSGNGPSFLTPVYFSKNVLNKYYEMPSVYSVEDGYLRCGHLWGIPIDNDHSDKVIVFLGDLGRIPPSEQKYWSSFCIQPSGGLSESNFKRSLLGQFAESKQPDLAFKQTYHDFHRKWRQSFGFDLLNELGPNDEFRLSSIRIPTDGETQYFENLVVALICILIESINVTYLKSFGLYFPEDSGSIVKLEIWIDKFALEDFSENIKFLKKLSKIRSKSLHRTSKNYDEILVREFELPRGSELASLLLNSAKKFLDDLVELDFVFP